MFPRKNAPGNRLKPVCGRCWGTRAWGRRGGWLAAAAGWRRVSRRIEATLKRRLRRKAKLDFVLYRVPALVHVGRLCQEVKFFIARGGRLHNSNSPPPSGGTAKSLPSQLPWFFPQSGVTDRSVLGTRHGAMPGTAYAKLQTNPPTHY